MNHIEQALSDAFEQLKRITISGIGTFTIIEQPYLLKPDQNIIYPPSKNVIFNSFLTFSDGKFEHFISEKFQISDDDAKKQIEDFANNIKTQVSNHQEYSILQFGKFSLSKSGNIDFKPESNSRINEDNFGLSEIIATPISAGLTNNNPETKPSQGETEKIIDPLPENIIPSLPEEETGQTHTEETEPLIQIIHNTPEPKKPISEEISAEVTENSETTTPESEITENQTTPEESGNNAEEFTESDIESIEIIEMSKKKKPWFTIIFITIIILASASWIYLNQDMIQDFLKKGNPTPTDTTQIITEEKDTIATQSSEFTEIQEDTSTVSTEANTPIESKTTPTEKENMSPGNTTDIPLSTNFEAGNYYIITGTFSNKTNAEKQVRRLSELGYSSLLIQNGAKYIAVAGIFKTKTEADNLNIKLQETEFSGSYIIKK